MKYNRRAFIKSIGFLYGSLLLVPSCTKNTSDSSFDEQYNACLEALCNQIIPDDEYPGAVKTGTPGFIKKQLSLHLDYCKEDYKNGLQALQTYCQNKFNRNFEELSSSQQINLMKQMEQNLLVGEEWNKLSSGAFFSMILKHTMMGFYGAPRHGGNKGYASYKMLRLDVPLVVGQNRY